MNRTRAATGLALATLVLLAGVSSAAGPDVRVISHGARSSGRVALTFDDGVSPANCRRILSILVARATPATFFPIGQAMRADPAFWRMVVAEGDPIGDHSLTHPEMPTLTEAQQFRQIDGDRQLAEKISGAPLLRVFRPPYGAYNSATLAAAARAGFPTVLLWDTSDRDTSPRGTVQEMLAAAEHATDGSVILMHCGPDATPYLLGPLLDHLKAAGLRPVTVPELLGLPWTATPASSPPTPAQILSGLAPFAPQASGGVVVGPNGIGNMTFPPAPLVTPGAPHSPRPTSSASSTSSPSPTSSASAASPSSEPASASPVSTSLIAAVASQPASPASPPGQDPTVSTTGVPADVALLAGLLVVLAAAAIIFAGLARARR